MLLSWQSQGQESMSFWNKTGALCDRFASAWYWEEGYLSSEVPEPITSYDIDIPTNLQLPIEISVAVRNVKYMRSQSGNMLKTQ